MSFLNELKAAYQDAQKSKLWTDEIKQAIAERAKSGDTQYTHYFDKSEVAAIEIDTFIDVVRQEGLFITCGEDRKYYAVTIYGWAD